MVSIPVGLSFQQPFSPWGDCLRPIKMSLKTTVVKWANNWVGCLSPSNCLDFNMEKGDLPDKCHSLIFSFAYLYNC